jgi:hypothetical protein
VATPDPLRSFLTRLPLTLLAAMLLWWLVRPLADASVAGFAQLLIRASEVPRMTRLVANDHWVEVRRADYRAGSRIPTLPLTEVHFNTIVLLALAFALPRPWSRRQLERLAAAWAVLLATQVLNLLFDVRSLYATRLGEWSLIAYSELSRNVLGFLQYFTDLPGRFSAPFLIWLGFNWDEVRQLVGVGVTEGAPAHEGGPRRGAKKPGRAQGARRAAGDP